MTSTLRPGLIFLCVFVVIASSELLAQVDTLDVDFYDTPLESLDSLQATDISEELGQVLNQPLSIASGAALNPRNSPNVVTVVSREEIERSGARDLIDVLRLVPGFTFALNEGGSVGLGIRGNWANEGKVLMMMDGQELNDIYSANLNFGNHYPVDLIDRIEIVRGPGSALYGGFAEYGVINIITRNPDTDRGLSFGYNFGQMAKTRGRRHRVFYVGQKWGNTSISFSSIGGSGMRSDQDHYGFYDNSLIDSLGIGAFSSLAGNSRLNPRITNFQVKAGRLSFRSIVDLYAYNDARVINENQRRRRLIKFRSNYSEFKYVYPVNDKLTLIPRFNWVVQFPQLSGLADSIIANQEDARVSRFRANFSANYAPDHRTHLIGGLEVFRDKAENNDQFVLNPLYIKEDKVTYNNLALFGQAILKRPWAHVILGARLDANSKYGAAFSPRLAITRRLNKFHFKFMISRAFRAPSIGNIARAFDGEEYEINADSTGVTSFEGTIEAERTWVQEAEIGYRLNENLILTANIFNTSTDDPIVYSFYTDSLIQSTFGEADGLLVYQNAERSGTRGFEFDVRYRHKKGYIYANYSYYDVSDKARVPAYTVSNFAFNPAERFEQEDDQLLAFSKHRLNLQACYYVADDISVNLTGSYLGMRYGYDVLLGGDVFDENNNLILPARFNVSGQLIQEKPVILANVFLRYDRLWNKRLKLGIGMYDIFNQKPAFLQPYFGLNAPLPGPSPEIIFKATWDILKFGEEDE